MTQRVRTLAVKAWGPAFESPADTSKKKKIQIKIQETKKPVVAESAKWHFSDKEVTI